MQKMHLPEYFRNPFLTIEAIADAIDKQIDYYNSRRIQVKTKWMPSSKFREAPMMVSELLHSNGGDQKAGSYQRMWSISES